MGKEQYVRWALVFSSAALFIISDALSAKWGKHDAKWALCLLFIIPPIGYICFGMLNKSTSLSVSSGLVNMILLIGTILIGIFYFGDSLTTRQGIGLALAVVALALMV